MRRGTTVTFLLGDHLGSTALAANGTTGALISEQRYKPWGEKRYPDGASTLPTRHRFTGQIEDVEVGLYFYNARSYSPALGRFISADTIVPSPSDPQSLNRFSYGLNNPVKYQDPSGHYVCTGYDSSWGDATCYDIVNNWIEILKSQGGDLGLELVQKFWDSDNRSPVKIQFVDSLGGWGQTDTRAGKVISILKGSDFGLEAPLDQQKLNSAFFGHELQHLASQQHPQIIGTAWGEKDAYDVTWNLLENMGLNPEQFASEAFKAIHNADYSDSGLEQVQALVNAPLGLRPAREGDSLLPYMGRRVQGGAYTVSHALAVGFEAMVFLISGCFGDVCGIGWNPSTNGWREKP
jgi:RHS repeat-associated protein